MKWLIYTAFAIIAVFVLIGLHAYFVNQSVCGANAKTYSSFYELNAAQEWIVNVGDCSIARPITIDAGSDMHDVLTQPFWLKKVGYIALQVISKVFGVVVY